VRFLAGYRGALVVVSHDLGLLDGAITRILHLDRDGVVQYRGTYSEYRAARRADEARLGALAGRQQAEVKRLKTLADSMRGRPSSVPRRRRRSTAASAGSRSMP
jgi:ATPase subunit of ABC transporter with duplicated ATPase domains